MFGRVARLLTGIAWAVTLESVPLEVLLMIQILHDLKDPKLWEAWYIPSDG